MGTNDTGDKEPVLLEMPSALSRLMAALGSNTGSKPPPVERWNPPHCGTIDLRIASDGSWHYNGSPILRPALVRLFSTVLRKDPEGYVLVTPVERLNITVDDVPFVACEMAVEEGKPRQIAFRTNVDDLVEVGAQHPLRFAQDESGGIRPYVRIRGGLEARLTRALALELISLGEEHLIEGQRTWAVSAGGDVFAVAPMTEIEGIS